MKRRKSPHRSPEAVCGSRTVSRRNGSRPSGLCLFWCCLLASTILVQCSGETEANEAAGTGEQRQGRGGGGGGGGTLSQAIRSHLLQDQDAPTNDLLAEVSNSDESYSHSFGPSADGDDLAGGQLAHTAPAASDSPGSESAGSEVSPEVGPSALFLEEEDSFRLEAMRGMMDRRQLGRSLQAQAQQIPAGAQQELSSISIGLDSLGGPTGPFGVSPFSPHNVPNHHRDGLPPPPHPKNLMSNADSIDQVLGPSLAFGLGPLPHLLGFQGGGPGGFEGPQRGEQSAHANHHAAASDSEPSAAGPQKVWPKIFRFTEGRINLSDFEKQKKIRLSSKNQHGSDNNNHIESAPIMFDGRQLKRKSFLILHGGVFHS